jgi:hypothetical protein
MERYTLIHNRIWLDEKFRELDTDSKMLFFYLMTSPHCNMIGYYRLPLLYIVADLGQEMQAIKPAFESLLQAGMVFYDERQSIVLIPNYLRYNRIQNPNQAKAACSLVDKLPQNLLLGEFLACIAEHAADFESVFAHLNGSETVTETLSEELPKPLSQGLPKQQSTEYRVQDISSPNGDSSAEADRESPQDESAADGANKDEQPDPVQLVMSEYNRIFAGLWKRPLTLTPDRRAKIRARLKRYSPGEIVQAMEAIRGSPWHCGDNPSGKVYATPEFICRNDGKLDEWLKKEVRINVQHANAASGDSLAANGIDLTKFEFREPNAAE